MTYPIPFNARRLSPFAKYSLALLVSLGAAQETAAQAAGRVEARAETITRRLQSITPRFGPPGTQVTVASGLMPAITPVRVGIGATRIGFETLAELLTSPTGEFSVPVVVPAWATPERSHRFILFDFYFNPIAMSDAFFVTDANGVFRRTGRVVKNGMPCVSLRDVDGELYTLVGETTELVENAPIVVEGKLTESSSGCGGNAAIGVLKISRVP